MGRLKVKYTSEWKNLRRLFKTGNPSVRVGVLASKGGGAQHSDGITLVELAAIHEFGSPAAGIPQRSFIRSTLETKGADLAKAVVMASKSIINGGSVKQALDRLGAWASTEIKNNVTRGSGILTASGEGLKQSTIDRKGSSRPLIDNGRMIGSVSWESKERGR
jgi:hypothetical protein